MIESSERTAFSNVFMVLFPWLNVSFITSFGIYLSSNIKTVLSWMQTNTIEDIKWWHEVVLCSYFLDPNPMKVLYYIIGAYISVHTLVIHWEEDVSLSMGDSCVKGKKCIIFFFNDVTQIWQVFCNFRYVLSNYFDLYCNSIWFCVIVINNLNNSLVINVIFPFQSINRKFRKIHHCFGHT